VNVQSTATSVMTKPKTGTELVDIYEQTADFVWKSLQRLGVPPADVEDLMQEVYVVAHRQLSGFRHEAKITTWLFAICLKVASRHRRRAYFRREQQVAETPESIDAHTPEAALDQRQRGARLERILGELNPEQRVVFVMFEIEGHSCQEIADLSAVPVGTVYSRLYSARKRVEKTLAHFKAADDRKEGA
jgi:RNA polymerase sigma-70 factor (ECF subfamily)